MKTNNIKSWKPKARSINVFIRFAAWRLMKAKALGEGGENFRLELN